MRQTAVLERHVFTPRTSSVEISGARGKCAESVGFDEWSGNVSFYHAFHPKSYLYEYAQTLVR